MQGTGHHAHSLWARKLGGWSLTGVGHEGMRALSSQVSKPSTGPRPPRGWAAVRLGEPRVMPVTPSPLRALRAAQCQGRRWLLAAAHSTARGENSVVVGDGSITSGAGVPDSLPDLLACPTPVPGRAQLLLFRALMGKRNPTSLSI